MQSLPLNKNKVADKANNKKVCLYSGQELLNNSLGEDKTVEENGDLARKTDSVAFRVYEVPDLKNSGTNVRPPVSQSDAESYHVRSLETIM